MKLFTLSGLAFALALFMTACGGGETEQPAQQQTAVDDGVRTIVIIGNDDMKFVVESPAEGLVTGGAVGSLTLLEAIQVAPGEEIRITLKTRSNLPPQVMAHNFVLVELGTDVDAFQRASLAARDNEFIAPDFEDQVLVATRMLSGGQEQTITFTAPETPGEYDYLCTFPGHFAAGMVGKLIVQ